MPIGFDVGDLVAGDDPAGIGADAFGEVVRAGQPLTAIVWTRWRTAEDEHVCPECGPIDGLAWPADEGPQAGRPAPPIALATMAAGKAWELASLRDKRAALVVFWASW